jgi:hypothetical protein
MLSSRVVMQYQSFLKIWKCFEGNKAYKIQDVSNEILENMDENNFKAIKQYAQISALNQLNAVLSNN